MDKILEMIPGMNKLPKAARPTIKHIEAIILSGNKPE